MCSFCGPSLSSDKIHSSYVDNLANFCRVIFFVANNKRLYMIVNIFVGQHENEMAGIQFAKHLDCESNAKSAHGLTQITL